MGLPWRGPADWPRCDCTSVTTLLYAEVKEESALLRASSVPLTVTVTGLPGSADSRLTVRPVAMVTDGESLVTVLPEPSTM